jgi:hypothetical protein
MKSRKEKFIAFDTHRYHAKRRGIAFLFSFEEWVTWWEKQLGPDWLGKRGRGKGKYVMARNKDKGPYQQQNVRCVLWEINRLEQTKNGRCRNNGGFKGVDHYNAKLTENQVRQIHDAEGSQKEIAEQYGVTRACVCDIKLERSWKHLWR